jgi:hypothetical protein
MWWLILIPFLLQALITVLDELIFHVRRGLPRWERIGHPLDTATVLICMLFVLWIPFSRTSLMIYCALAIFSTLFVTKDEFVHKECCPWKEQWLHALLFTVHPVTLTAAGLIWPVVQQVEVSPWLAQWLHEPHYLKLFLYGQAIAMGVFLFYQIVYWNFLWKET